MPSTTEKFSEFTNGNEAQVGDQVVGLRSAANYRFDFPGAGIKDANGNFLIGWASAGAAAVNYPLVTSSLTTSGVIYGATGTDADVNIIVQPMGAGAVIADGNQLPTSTGIAGQLVCVVTPGEWGYTTGTFPIPPGPAGTILRSDGAAWLASTSTFADIYATHTILYSNGANTVTGLATANSAAMITTSAGVPGWSSSMTNGQVIIGSTGATPTAATLTAGTNVSIVNAAGSVTISATASGGGYTWVDVTGTTQAMAINTAYITNNGSLVTLTLPTTAAVGTTQAISGKGAGGWVITQGAGQSIHIGNAATTIGVGGSLASSNRYDSLELVCITADLEWNTVSSPQSSGLTVI